MILLSLHVVRSYHQGEHANVTQWDLIKISYQNLTYSIILVLSIAITSVAWVPLHLNASSADISLYLRCAVSRATVSLSITLAQRRKIKQVTLPPSRPCSRVRDRFNEFRVTDHDCWILWPPSPLSANHFPFDEHPHTEQVFFHIWDCLWVTSITKIHLLSSVASILIQFWQRRRN